MLCCSNIPSQSFLQVLLFLILGLFLGPEHRVKKLLHQNDVTVLKGPEPLNYIVKFGFVLGHEHRVLLGKYPYFYLRCSVPLLLLAFKMTRQNLHATRSVISPFLFKLFSTKTWPNNWHSWSFSTNGWNRTNNGRSETTMTCFAQVGKWIHYLHLVLMQHFFHQEVRLPL